ncbi:MAG: FecR family protein [Thiobacillus sp.]|nr:FecR family protein [Thiobacillus sp.]
MNDPQRIWPVLLLFLLTLAGAAPAADDDEAWAPTPPRLSFIDGEVSTWRPGADEWVRARPNLALAEGDALYTGKDSNFEVQFDSRSFARADEHTQLSLLQREKHLIQFKVASGRVSFDMRSLAEGAVEVSTPNAVFVIEHPGYYRVEVDSRDTHFITRRGGEATVITADGRSLDIYPSEDVVVTAGDPVKVATYAAQAPDAWDRWNDARSDRSGESISARYLPPGVYGAEELDHYGRWRVVPTYGAVWIPDGMGATWTPYSTGYWVWDPYYAWTWIDDAPWGWAPFHYGRWVYIDGYWAWAPGPVARRPLYSPALVAFMIRDRDVSARLSTGLPGVWWVALSWGEPVLPWWGPPRYRGRPWWGGWGGPRIVNNAMVTQTTVIEVGDIRYHNARLPRAILTAPADRFGRERVRATAETRFRHTDFAPVRGELPIKPSRASLVGGAPKGVRPPREIVSRPVVSTRPPRERVQPWPDAPPGAYPPVVPAPRYKVPPARRAEDARIRQRPPFGAETGPERSPPPRSPRYEEIRKSAIPRAQATVRGQSAIREQGAARREVGPVPRPAPPAVVAPPVVSRPPVPGRVQDPRTRIESAPLRGEARQGGKERPLPGQPASRTYRARP